MVSRIEGEEMTALVFLCVLIVLIVLACVTRPDELLCEEFRHTLCSKLGRATGDWLSPTTQDSVVQTVLRRYPHISDRTRVYVQPDGHLCAVVGSNRLIFRQVSTPELSFWAVYEPTADVLLINNVVKK